MGKLAPARVVNGLLRWSISHGQFGRSIIYITNVKLPGKSEPLNERGVFAMGNGDDSLYVLSGGKKLCLEAQNMIILINGKHCPKTRYYREK